MNSSARSTTDPTSTIALVESVTYLAHGVECIECGCVPEYFEHIGDTCRALHRTSHSQYRLCIVKGQSGCE